MGKPKAWRRGRNPLKSKSISVVNINSAGIDIGSEENWVAVPNDRDTESVRRFGCFTSDIASMADWLKECGITSVAMESTGVYWIPVFQFLEEKGFDVVLVNARDIKNVPGRKTDQKDCQWIQQLHMYGLLRGSFRPESQVCHLRTLVRQRDVLVKNSGQHIQRMQKALTQMNVQLHKVISDITGVTGLRILDAVIDGERDPQKLAALAHVRIKCSRKTIAQALEGDWNVEQIFCLKQELEAYRFFSSQIISCEEQIRSCLDMFDNADTVSNENSDEVKKKQYYKPVSFDLVEHLRRIIGFDLTTVPGINGLMLLTLLSEVGIDMSKWATERHFSSWLGLSPNHKISGGKILGRQSRKVINRAASALRLAAQSAGQTPTALGAFYRRLKGRVGPSKAITATARKLACIYYRCLKNGAEYVELGMKYYETKYENRLINNLRKRAEKLGMKIVPIDNQTEDIALCQST
jgi:transposase